MARIAYILLCHKSPEDVIEQAQRLTAGGDYVAIHYDKRSDQRQYDTLRASLDLNASVAFTPKRIKCGWGEWSLVEATLLAVKTAEAAFPNATHFYMLSGDCMPIKSARYMKDYLDRDDVDHIESFDFFTSNWIKIGLKEERLIYRHWFNERNNKPLFYAAMKLQKRLHLQRQPPNDIAVHIGSQWWCLRRRTVEWILDFIKKRRDVMRFFKTTWIPDEIFFQTLVRHLVPETEIRNRTLTFLLFTDYGMPAVFYNDHYDLLLSQDYLFARKISPLAVELKQRLGALYSDTTANFAISNEGKSLFHFLTSRGRIGRRFAPRFWDNSSDDLSNQTLLIVACKKWHVAKRLIERLRSLQHLPTIAYLFDELATPLPDLGGIESTLDKRNRYRRSLIPMLFESWNTEKLVICIDTANVDLIKNLCQDGRPVRLLEIDCTFSDDYLLGHAKRVGLAADQSPQVTLDRLLPTIRYDVRFESDRIRQLKLPHHYRLRQIDSDAEKAQSLADFLMIEAKECREILAMKHLFAD